MECATEIVRNLVREEQAREWDKIEPEATIQPIKEIEEEAQDLVA